MNNTPTPSKNETAVRLYDEAQVFEGSRPSGLLIQGGDEILRLERELAAVTEQRDEWKAKYIQQNKDLGCEMMDPNGTIWDYAKKLQPELAAAREEIVKLTKGWADCVLRLSKAEEQRDQYKAALQSADNHNHEIATKLEIVTEQRDKYHDYWESFGEERIKLKTELAAVTEQRDRLAEALQSVKCELGVPQPEYPLPVANAYWIANKALQSLNQPTP